METPALLKLQRAELSECIVYERLAKLTSNPHNAAIIARIAKEERGHHEVWKSITKQEVQPDRLKIAIYTTIARIFGLSFGLKLMEQGEGNAQATYGNLVATYPALAKVVEEEHAHEQELLSLINTHALEYASSVILGLNDALIELTGALIGFTLALAEPRLVATVGLITGLAASLSMASASYLSAREGNHDNPLIAGLVTGGSYTITTILLVAPYFFLHNPWAALAITIAFVIAIIAIFNFYTSVVKNISFKKRFLEMLGISIVVGTINFGIGVAVKRFFNV